MCSVGMLRDVIPGVTYSERAVKGLVEGSLYQASYVKVSGFQPIVRVFFLAIDVY